MKVLCKYHFHFITFSELLQKLNFFQICPTSVPYTVGIGWYIKLSHAPSFFLSCHTIVENMLKVFGLITRAGENLHNLAGNLKKTKEFDKKFPCIL